MSETPVDHVWQPVCKLDDVPINGGVTVPAEPPIAVFRVGNACFATAETCTHATFSMAGGFVDDDCTVECELHGAVFCLRTGAVLKGPASVALATYPIKIEDGVVYVAPHSPSGPGMA
ncbi:MAG TPA: non-heme iron oxygenase ferredoxin subunit [Pararobbsia sp.]|nr:non-heme iron oxygenase ferredoxin subunit [Pararobbsia sp.]